VQVVMTVLRQGEGRGWQLRKVGIDEGGEAEYTPSGEWPRGQRRILVGAAGGHEHEPRFVNCSLFSPFFPFLSIFTAEHIWQATLAL
jgi:hypothetical protein